MQVVRPGEPRWELVEAFVAGTDPLDDLLLHADVVSDLGRLSTVWLRTDGGRPTAVAFSFPLHPARPALGVRGRTRADEAAAIADLVRAGAWGPGYVICPHDQVTCWLACGQAAPGHDELHMIVRSSGRRDQPTHPAVRRAGLAEVDAFYRTHGAAAWNPAQFDTGPYVVAEQDGVIVAAAGTHFAYPGLVQLGNVLTAPDHRGRGWAKACTAAVMTEREITYSLFVDAGNKAAIKVYEGLGFTAHRSLAAFAWL